MKQFETQSKVPLLRERICIKVYIYVMKVILRIIFEPEKNNYKSIKKQQFFSTPANFIYIYVSKNDLEKKTG